MLTALFYPLREEEFRKRGLVGVAWEGWRVMGIITLHFPGFGSPELKFRARFPSGYRSVMTLDAHLLWTQTRVKRSGLANDHHLDIHNTFLVRCFFNHLVLCLSPAVKWLSVCSFSKCVMKRRSRIVKCNSAQKLPLFVC